MRVGMLSPIAWRTPPRHYGPWERVVSLLTEQLIELGLDVTLFATGDSLTRAKLRAICPRGYEEDSSLEPKVWECLHISRIFESADEFDLIHNHFDFLPLTYSGLVETPVITTIHGFSSSNILPVYQKYNDQNYYISISNSSRSPLLSYQDTVYHGIDLENFTFNPHPGEYLLFFGRLNPDKGPEAAIEIARSAGRKLILAGIIQDREYFQKEIQPHLKENSVEYVGSVAPAERDKLLRNSFALLHPININEPFGLSVVEAMACGTPVIAFSRGSMPELIKDGQTGFLVSGIEEATKAVKKISHLDRKRCREEVENRFSDRQMAQNYLRVYKKVIAK